MTRFIFSYKYQNCHTAHFNFVIFMKIKNLTVETGRGLGVWGEASLSVRLSIRLSVRLSVCLSVCASIILTDIKKAGLGLI